MCSTQPEELTKRLKSSNKILLPPSVLYELNQQDLSDNIMFFKVSNKEMQFGIVCGVHEFSAPPGICHVPFHIMNNIGITEGQEVEIEKICAVQGTYMKLRPHKTEFINLSNPKAVLERIMSRDYPVVSQGQTIELNYEDLNCRYRIDIVETNPAEIISIVNTDINIDFDQPLDYVEPQYNPSPKPLSPVADTPQNKIISRETQLKSMQNPITKQFVPFSGQGNKLGSD
jgi:ubiquitin fusion degradation protein 1